MQVELKDERGRPTFTITGIDVNGEEFTKVLEVKEVEELLTKLSKTFNTAMINYYI